MSDLLKFNPEQLHDTLLSISGGIESYAIPLAALGVMTMALLEVVKKLTNRLATFHDNAIKAWLAEPATSGVWPQPYAAETGAKAKNVDKAYDPNHAYAELLHLTTGAGIDATPRTGIGRRTEYALFDLELARLMSQVQDASEAAMSNPDRYPHLFTFMTRGADPQDVATWLDLRAHREDSRPPESARIAAERQAALYGRIKLLTRRQLDAFQTVTDYRWREWNQFAAWLLGFSLMLIALSLTPTSAKSVLSLFDMIIVSLFGGIFAPVAKDLVSALAKLKR